MLSVNALETQQMTETHGMLIRTHLCKYNTTEFNILFLYFHDIHSADVSPSQRHVFKLNTSRWWNISGYGYVWFDCRGHFLGYVARTEPASAATASVCSTVQELRLRGASLKQEGWKDLATHLHVMPVKACLQLDLQRRSDILAHHSTIPGGRGLEGRETEQERNRERAKERQTKKKESTREVEAVKAERDKEEPRLKKQVKPYELRDRGSRTHTLTHTSGSVHIVQLFPLHHTRLSPPFISLPVSISPPHSLSAATVNPPQFEPNMLHHHISNHTHTHP